MVLRESQVTHLHCKDSNSVLIKASAGGAEAMEIIGLGGVNEQQGESTFAPATGNLYNCYTTKLLHLLLLKHSLICML